MRGKEYVSWGVQGIQEWAMEFMWRGRKKGACLVRGREPARERNQNLMISEKLTDNFYQLFDQILNI